MKGSNEKNVFLNVFSPFFSSFSMSLTLDELEKTAKLLTGKRQRKNSVLSAQFLKMAQYFFLASLNITSLLSKKI